MRIGFVLGFLIGALVASVKGETRVAEAPGTTEVPPEEPGEEPAGLIDKLKRQVRQAIAAARAEAGRKEDEMRRQFEEAKQPHR